MEYKVEVSLPQYFTLPTTVKIPITQEDSVLWENPAGKTHIGVGFCAPARTIHQHGVKFPSSSPSSSFSTSATLSGVGSLGQQSLQRYPDFLGLSHLLQLIQWDPESFLGQPRWAGGGD